MYLVLKFCLSIVEWAALVSFPLILLGYPFRYYLKKILAIAAAMSLFSMLLHLTPIHLGIIVALQIALFFVFIKKLLDKNVMETVVLSTIGYGFYTLIQFLLIEIIIVLSAYSYFEVIFSTNFITLVLQAITAIIVTSVCFVLHANHYHLNELKYHITAQQIPHKIKLYIYAFSLLTFVFISLAAFVMLADNLPFRNGLILMCIIVMIFILSFYHILYIQFQKKQLIETKKFYLDQDQQFISMIEKIKEDSQNHFKAIMKLSNKGAPDLIRSYIEKEKLAKDFNPNILSAHDFNHEGEPLDELIYAFLINKRRLARICNIHMEVHSNISKDIPITFQQIKNLNNVFNNLIFNLYRQENDINKMIYFEVSTQGDELKFCISSPLQINSQRFTDLNLINSLKEFNHTHISVASQFNPFNATIKIKNVE